MDTLKIKTSMCQNKDDEFGLIVSLKSIFYPLKALDCCSKTQYQVGKISFYKLAHNKLY